MNLVFTRRQPVPDPARPVHPGMARAHQSVMRQLDELGPAWVGLHGIPVGSHGSTIEHLAIGPGGLYVVKIRHHPRLRVRVHEQIVMVNDFPTPHLAHAVYEGQRVARLLGRAMGVRVRVDPVLAFADSAVHVVAPPANAHVLAARRVGWFLARQPRRLDAEAVAAITEVARASATWHDDT